MKKNYAVFVILSNLFFAITILAQPSSTTNVSRQSSACITWDLLSTTSVTSTVGNINGQAESMGVGSSAPFMSVFLPYSNGQRLWVGNTGWIAGPLDPMRYIEFNTSPQSGNSFTVTNVSFNYGDNPLSTNFNILNFKAYYSIDNWVNSTALNSTALVYLNTSVSVFAQTINVLVPSGKTFSLRIYPYALQNGIAMTPTFAIHKNVVICGTTDPEVLNSGSICGTKFNDLNGNGVKDAGEPGLPNWLIGLGVATIPPVRTDSLGNYCFNNLPAGTYTISETSQSGWQQTFPSSPGTHTITLAAGQSVGNINFGNKSVSTFGSICGTKFNDLNGNGVKDAGEPGLPNWLIGLGVATIPPVLTDSLGNYCFKNLPAGAYTISETNQSGWQQTFPSSPGTHTITLAAGQSISNINFGNKSVSTFGSICGTKFNDLNGNGIKDAGEPGLPNWLIGLGVATVPPVLTDSLGNYCFNNLPAGTYTISETSQSGWQQTFPPSPGTHTVTLATGQSAGNINFGNKSVSTFGSICGTKFNDLNGNGVKDAGEPGLPNWLIGLGVATVPPVMTDLLGNYCFNNLPAGTYTISETSQSGWQQTFPPSPGTHTVTLATGQSVGNINFGNKIVPTSVDDDKTGNTLPKGVQLEQNYPNPFNPSTRIKYSLEKSAQVSLKVYNVFGIEVAMLVNGHQEAGSYTVLFDTNKGPFSFSSGVYFYRLIAGKFQQTRKLLLLK